MKRALNLFSAFSFIIVSAVICGCNDPAAIFDQNTEIANRNWSYVNNVRYNVKVDDVQSAYNIYFNLRVSGDYKYSNLFVLLHTNGPGINNKVLRYEIKLAAADGEWLGSGSGSLYSYQVPFKTNYHFPAAGTYHFEIEQNMRDNPLHEVSDVGLRVEKVK